MVQWKVHTIEESLTHRCCTAHVIVHWFYFDLSLYDWTQLGKSWHILVDLVLTSFILGRSCFFSCGAFSHRLTRMPYLYW